MVIEPANRDGYDALTLREGDLAATFVPRLGMIGASLEHRGHELLGQRKGLAAYEASGSTMGIPLLHPWANRLGGLTYDVAGQHVTIDPDHPRIRLDPNGLPIHGLLAANPHWHVEQQDESGLTAALGFGAQPELLEAFPFPHTLRIHVTLSSGPSTLTIATTIDADKGSPVPVSFGFHPYLTLPGTPRADWQVELPRMRHLTADDRGIPTGESEPSEPQQQRLGDRDFDDGYSDLEGDPPTFALSDATRRVETTFDSGYPFAQVYAPPDQDLICFEPMTAATNALAAGGPGGLAIVEPGSSRTATFSIAVRDL